MDYILLTKIIEYISIEDLIILYNNEYIYEKYSGKKSIFKKFITSCLRSKDKNTWEKISSMNLNEIFMNDFEDKIKWNIIFDLTNENMLLKYYENVNLIKNDEFCFL